MKSVFLTGVIVTALFSIHCSSGSTGTGEDQSAASAASTSSMSKTISSSYGITTFGGAGDYQTMACGGNTKTANEWYVASSQRYGCHQHLKLTASNGKCVVVSTEDAGPAAYVESAAGEPILDSSPAVAKYLFGESGLGSSDVKANQSAYTVATSETDDDVGPCSSDSGESTSSSASSASSASDAPATSGTKTSTPSSSGSSSSGSASQPTNTGDDDDDNATPPNVGDDDDDTGGGQACGSDGQCNPGNDGSGLICSGGFCVPGCHTDAQCPGVTSCSDGQCE